jgi:hypothetical protein
VIAEIQPAVAMLLEMRGITEELVTEMLDREAGERFPGLVGGEAKKDVEAAFKRLWGKNGESYKDAAPTLLGKLRAAKADAFQLVASKQPAPRKDDSQKKAQRLPASPSRTAPTKAKDLDGQIEDIIDASMKRWDNK